MNKVYRLIWSHHQQALVVVSEHTRGRGKLGGKAKTVATAVALAVLSFSEPSQAACTAGPDTYTCSGAELSTRTLSGAPLDITLDSTFSMNAAAGNGLTLTGTNGLTLTQSVNGGDIEATGTSILLTNNNGGLTTLNLTGALTGNAGIVANANAGTSNLSITTADIVAVNRGIFVYSNASGSTTLDTSAGAVSSTNEDGVRIQNNGTATSSMVTTADVIGARYGLWLSHSGSGNTAVDTTAGTIQGGLAGIIAQNAFNSTSTASMTVTTADVSGGDFGGVWVQQNALGALSVDTTAGTVTRTGAGTTYAALNAYISNVASNANMAVTTADVNGIWRGILVEQYGSGNLTLDTIAGTVTGTAEKGIMARMLAGSGDLTITTADVTGGQYGIHAQNSGIGSATIDTTGGTLTTTIGTALYSAGILARTSATSTDLTITTGDVNTAGSRGTGIRTYNDGTGLTTIDTTLGTITATYDGVHARNGYTTTDLSITTATVTSSQYGVAARNYGTGSTVIDTTRGSITANSGDGVSVFTSNTVANLTITTADVFGGTSGMVALNYGNGSTTIDSTRGSVSGGSFQGINALNDPSTTDLTITTADVTGGVQEGILARNNGTGSTTIDTTAGSVAGGTRGIRTTNSATTTDLAITTANVTATNGIGIEAQNNGTGATVIDTTTGSVTSTNGIGLNISTAVNATSLNITTSDVSGNMVTDVNRGIQVSHRGSGLAAIDTTAGTVSAYRGINAKAYGAGNLRLTTGSVNGVRYGVWATSYGTGSTIVDTTRGTLSSNYIAIVAQTYNATNGALTVTTADVIGGVGANAGGIYAYHKGNGDMTIDTTAGTVTAAGGTWGIYALTLGSAINMDITTADVSSATYGILAKHDGSGSASIDTTRGAISGSSGDGLVAFNYANTTDLTITTADVTGVQDGIRARNSGIGSNIMNSTAGVVSGGRDGIYAYTSNTATNLSVTTANVSGGRYGLNTYHQGTGATAINTMAGSVSGVRRAVTAKMSGNATDLMIITADVMGGQYGVLTNHQGIGATTVNTTAGMVTGTSYMGLGVFNAATATDMTITAGNVFGGQYGIDANNLGTGSTSIIVAPGGVVQGGTAGISAIHASEAPFTIMINGEVRNSSGVASDRALIAASTGSGVTLNNNSNTIIGTANLTVAYDTFNNVGSWFTENGTSDFGGGNDILNNTGLIRAANNIVLAETTRFNNLELFNHSGIATLQDGTVGDTLITSGNFVGNSGEVRLDTVLDTGTGGSDVLRVNGNVAGSTLLRIANAGGAGGQTNGDGILVVQVNGTSTANAFNLAAPVKAGIWDYQLDYAGTNNTNQNWYLTNHGVNEIGAVYESAPRILLDTLQPISTLQQRVGQRLVFGPSGQQGFWQRALGEWRDVRPAHSTAGGNWDSRTWTMQLGYDHLVAEAKSGDLVVGLTGHYNQVNADIQNLNGRGELNGDSYGGGLTATWYGKQGIYLDLQAAFSGLSTRFASDVWGELAKGRSGYAYTLSAETGYRWALTDNQTLIPQFQVYTMQMQQDNFTDGQNNQVVFDNHALNIARFGLAWELRSASNHRFYLLGNLLHNLDSATTSVTVNGTALQTVQYDNAAEVGFGGSLGINQNLMLYGEGNYRQDLDAGKNQAFLVTAGVRLTW